MPLSTKKLRRCLECGLWYEDEKWAARCETWRGEHKSCNVEIINHAERDDENKD